jgi:hypothetical protein
VDYLGNLFLSILKEAESSRNVIKLKSNLALCDSWYCILKIPLGRNLRPADVITSLCLTFMYLSFFLELCLKLLVILKEKMTSWTISVKNKINKNRIYKANTLCCIEETIFSP